ncbi:YjaG family protein [Agarivorans sp.]|uniref:YjaG family protein n=1 Tax=Agarivorans sp. TaxID=1872412 RepID=UPI003CFDB44D
MLTPCDTERLTRLTSQQQSLYCLGLLQRMAPNYLLFCQAVELEHDAAFNKLLALFWEGVMHPKTKINFSAQRERFDALIPEPQDYDMFGVYPALDCCVVVDCLFSCLLEATGEEAEQASQTSLASVLSLLELQFGEQTEQQIMDQPLVVQELAFQSELLDHIERLDGSKTSLQALKTLAINQGVSNLGISLDSGNE